MKFFLKTFLNTFMIVLLLSACTHNSNSRAAIGTHNLSKGQCSAPNYCQGDDCKNKNESMTMAECEVLGGEFTPREERPRKRFWLF